MAIHPRSSERGIQAFLREGGNMGKVRLGLIGMGMIGKLHAETMSKMKDVELVAACDIETKHQKIAEEVGQNSTDPMKK